MKYHMALYKQFRRSQSCLIVIQTDCLLSAYTVAKSGPKHLKLRGSKEKVEIKQIDVWTCVALH